MRVVHTCSSDCEAGEYLIAFGIPSGTVVDISAEQLEELISKSPCPLGFGVGACGDPYPKDVIGIGHVYDW